MVKWNILGKHKEGSDVVSEIIKQRGIADKEDFLKDRSLKECVEQMPADFKKTLRKASDYIKESMSLGRTIVVFGDYDSDGINATAILYNFLKKEKGYDKVSYFIPNRFDHSYGISKPAIDDVLKEVGSKAPVLFITVDVGITAFDEVAYIKKLGNFVVLTDHHQKPEELPNADCIVWNDSVCGAVISWLLTRFLGSKDKNSISMAALATVTDLQKLTGFNREVVKKGLMVLNSTPPLGLKKLLEVSGKEVSEITSYELGWVLGPRLNASGRMETAKDSIRILVEDDKKLLSELAKSLNSKNIQRQEKTLEMYEVAADFDKKGKKKLPKVIFSSDKKYHEGIIGLVAAKLVQTYYRPAIVMCVMDDYAKGSVRSIAGVNVIEMLREFSDMFIDLGGHPMAAGFTIDKKEIPQFEKKFLKYAESKIEERFLTPTLNVDMKIPTDIINEKLLNEIERMEPFGIGNEQPLFVSEAFGIVNSDITGKDKRHLKLSLYDGNKYHKAIYFGGAEHENDLKVGEKIDLVYTLKKNEYNGNKYVDLVVRDFRKV
ncbi:single-stranded-DNA-specific exonuclease RecJ [Patescibacteria group bacterium]|nr:single-stranded-DNA-specific exonuclease RecJ [Patescibacteria group bacterium]